MDVTGRCLCGAVSFSASGVDDKLHVCHCRMCQHWFGGPALGVSAGSVEFDDESGISTYASSDWAERGFCGRCGSNLFYRLKDGSHIVLFTGTFDQPDGFSLGGEIFIDHKPSSYAFTGDHSRLTGDEFWASIGQSGG